MTPPQPKKSNFLRAFFTVIALILFGILLGVLAARFLPMPGASVTLTPTPTLAPTIALTPTPTAAITPVSTPSAVLEKTATISASINSLFNSVNKLFNSSIVPSKVNIFIDNGQVINQTAWKLDLNSVVKTKPDWITIVDLFEKQLKFKTIGGADGVDGGVTYYESSLLKCNYSQGTNNNAITCIEK